MLKGFDFTSLSSKEFELLCRDIVQRMISVEIGKTFVFTSFKEGKDAGVDALYYDKEYFIVLQAKRYNNFENL